MTPEGRVKAQIKKVLEKHWVNIWYDMPVPSGYGKSTLDFIGCCDELFFAIEAKAHGKKPTPLQRNMLDDISDAGGMTFVIIGLNSPELKRLDLWLGGKR